MGRIKKQRICTPENIAKISEKNKQLWEEYRNDMILEKGDKAKKTLITYKSAIFAFMIWLAENHGDKYVLDVNHKIYKNYLFHCQQKLGNKGKRRNNKTSALSSLMNFAVREDYIEFNPLQNKLKRADVSTESVIEQPFLTEEQINEIRNKISEFKSEHQRIYYRMFLEVAFSTAARVGALEQFSEENLILDKRYFENITEKRSKVRDLTFSNIAKEWLEKWIQYKRDNEIDTDAIFAVNYNGQWKGASIGALQKQSKKLFMLIGVNGHCHTWRKSYSNCMKQKGVPIEHIQEKLGHESSDTTIKFYTRKDSSKNQEELDKYEI